MFSRYSYSDPRLETGFGFLSAEEKLEAINKWLDDKEKDDRRRSEERDEQIDALKEMVTLTRKQINNLEEEEARKRVLGKLAAREPASTREPSQAAASPEAAYLNVFERHPTYAPSFGRRASRRLSIFDPPSPSSAKQTLTRERIFQTPEKKETSSPDPASSTSSAAPVSSSAPALTLADPASAASLDLAAIISSTISALGPFLAPPFLSMIHFRKCL